MRDVMISRAVPSDQPQLHALWRDVFGDPPELIQQFYNHFPPDVAAWTVRCGEEILTAAYLIPGNWYMHRDVLQPAGYVYAVATKPDARGNGYAGRLMRAMHEEAKTRSLLLYTRPAEAALFPWYEETMQARHTGRMVETTVQRNEAQAHPCRPVSAEAYGSLREQHLADTPHIVLSERFLRLQEQYSDGYFATDDGCGCCMVRQDQVLIAEYLGEPDTAPRFAQSVMAKTNCSSAVIRLTSPEGTLPSAAYCGEMLPLSTHWGLFLE